MATVTCGHCGAADSVTCDRAKGERQAFCGVCGPKRMRAVEARLAVAEALLVRMAARMDARETGGS